MTNSFVFYKSFYDAMQILDNTDKCDFMDLICNLAFHDVEPDFDNTEHSDIVKAMFAITSEQIKASIKHRNAGAKGGTQKGINTKNSLLNSELNSTLNTNDNDNENVNVNVNVKVNDNVNEINNHSSSFFDIQKLLIDLTSQYGFKINKKSFTKIINLIECTYANPEQAIKERCEYINAHYSDETSDSKNALLFKSFKWSLSEIQKIEEQKKTPVQEEENPAPKKCPVCNHRLIKNGLNSVICGHCREQGKIIWYEKENGNWIRQDSEAT